jgi:predicted secreted protein
MHTRGSPPRRLSRRCLIVAGAACGASSIIPRAVLAHGVHEPAAGSGQAASSAQSASAQSAQDAIAQLLGGRKAVPSDTVRIDVPLSLEHGASVPLGIAVAGHAGGVRVRRIDVFVDGNPIPQVASFHFGRAAAGEVATRFRLDKGGHHVYAVAELSDGSVLTNSADVATKTSGCSGPSTIKPGSIAPVPVPRVKMPDLVRAGELAAVHTMIAHRMESGFRSGSDGTLLPRKIINRMECRYGGEIAFAAELAPAIAANAYLKFQMEALEGGDIEFAWYEDGGEVYRALDRLRVS